MKRVFGFTFLLLILLSGMSLAETSESQAEKARQDFERVTREIQTQKKQEKDLRKREKSLLDRLDRLAFQLDRKTKELKALERERVRTERAISAHEDEARELHGQMAVTRERIRSRVVALYKASKTGPWAFLLSAENYGDFLRMLTLLNTVIDHDTRLLSTFENQLEQEEMLRKKLAAYKSELGEKEAKVRLRRRETESLRRQKQTALKEVRAQKTSFAKVVQDLEKQAETLQSLIGRLSTQDQSTVQETSGFRTMMGRLPLPVAGKIATGVQRKRRGICLDAPLGAIVRGVYKGRVVYAGWFKGYGNLLIIDHGDKFHTVIGHASELLKKKDDWVETGEPVARVGGTGSLGGSSLYFEIRHGGIALNPLDWFSKEDQFALR